MKTASLSQLRHNFCALLEWITEGEEVAILKKGKVVALLSPPPRPKAKKFKLPDFAARQQRIFGDNILPGNTVAEERAS